MTERRPAQGHGPAPRPRADDRHGRGRCCWSASTRSACERVEVSEHDILRRRADRGAGAARRRAGLSARTAPHFWGLHSRRGTGRDYVCRAHGTLPVPGTIGSDVPALFRRLPPSGPLSRRPRRGTYPCPSLTGPARKPPLGGFRPCQGRTPRSRGSRRPPRRAPRAPRSGPTSSATRRSTSAKSRSMPVRPVGGEQWIAGAAQRDDRQRAAAGSRGTAGWLVAPTPARYQAMLDAKAPGRAYTRARSSSWSGRRMSRSPAQWCQKWPRYGARPRRGPRRAALGQRQAVEVLVPELALGPRLVGHGRRSGTASRHGDDALGRAPRDRLRHAAADVVAGHADPLAPSSSRSPSTLEAAASAL